MKSTACFTIITSWILLQITLSRTENLAELVEMDTTITKENFFEPCYKPGFCFFLGPSFQKSSIEGNPSVCKDKEDFCMKLNIKPADEKCEKYHFEVAAIQIDDGGLDGTHWIAVAFKHEDNNMFSNLFVYCKGSVFRHGIIGDREVTPGDVSKSWIPPPTDNISYYKRDRFVRCEFKAARKTQSPNKNKPVDFSLGDTYLLMAHGIKHSKEKNLESVDQHMNFGHTDEKITSIKLDDCPPLPKVCPKRHTNCRSSHNARSVYLTFFTCLLWLIFNA